MDPVISSMYRQFLANWPPQWPYIPDRDGRCPHCAREVTFKETRYSGTDFCGFEGAVGALATAKLKFPCRYDLIAALCPSCRRPVISLLWRSNDTCTGPYVIWPRASARGPVPDAVPAHIGRDYTEAAMILADSPNASAALSRRCLQNLLREAGRVSQGRLSEQIEEAIPSLPPYIGADLHTLREIGNLAAHPTKDADTGAIVDVDPAEAEWTLDVLDRLFEHYYVNPTVSQERRRIINEKRKQAGRRPLP